MIDSDQIRETEPVRGLPAPLPAGETLLWQGGPAWWPLARSAFHFNKIAIYFGLMIAWRIATSLSEGAPHLNAGLSALPLLASGLVCPGDPAGPGLGVGAGIGLYDNRQADRAADRHRLPDGPEHPVPPDRQRGAEDPQRRQRRHSRGADGRQPRRVAAAVAPCAALADAETRSRRCAPSPMRPHVAAHPGPGLDGGQRRQRRDHSRPPAGASAAKTAATAGSDGGTDMTATTASPLSEPVFPKGALIGAALLVAFTVTSAAVSRISGLGTVQMPEHRPVESRPLRFEDMRDGSIQVTDARTGTGGRIGRTGHQRLHPGHAARLGARAETPGHRDRAALHADPLGRRPPVAGRPRRPAG